MKGVSAFLAMLSLLAVGYLTACGSNQKEQQPTIITGQYILTVSGITTTR
jgi:hypothetical protein